MQGEAPEARFMRRKVKAGLIEADHDACAIVVHYEVEATVLGELGEPIVAERQENTKAIKLKTLNENTNLERLAEEILDKCKLIHPSKLIRVHELLVELQRGRARRERGERAGGGSRRRKAGAPAAAGAGGSSGANETPSIDALDSYIDRTYDGTEAATQATHMMLQLSRSADNLGRMVENESLVGLLCRLLKEEGRKSMDLATNIMYIFFSISSFSQFHPLLAQGQVGTAILWTIASENKRHALRKAEAPAAAETREEKEARKRTRLMARKAEKLVYVSFHVLHNLAEVPEIEKKMVKKGIIGQLGLALERDHSELHVLALVFLKKLAIFKENLPSLRGAKLIPRIEKCLSSSSPEPATICALRLLFNLTFDKACRESMHPILPRLVKLLNRREKAPTIVPLAQRLLYQISVDEKARKELGKTDAPTIVRKQIVGCLDHELPADLAALAINLATDATAAEAQQQQRRQQQHCPPTPREPRTAPPGAQRRRRAAPADGAPLPLARRATAQAPAQCGSARRRRRAAGGVRVGPARARAAGHAPRLRRDGPREATAGRQQQVSSEELLLELLGLLGALRLGRIEDAPDLAAKHVILPFLHRYFVPGFAEDDVLLQVIILVGEFASHEVCAVEMARTGMVAVDTEATDAYGGPAANHSLFSLLAEKSGDDEMVLQCLHAFCKLLQFSEPRELLLQQTQIVIYLLDLLVDANKAIARVASNCLDAVAEADEQWASQIRQRKFAMHNQEWLEVVDEDEAEEYQDAVALNNAVNSLHMPAPLDASALDGEDEYLPEGSPLPIGADANGYTLGAEYSLDPESAYLDSAYGETCIDAGVYGTEASYASGYADGGYDEGGYADQYAAEGGYADPGYAEQPDAYADTQGYGADAYAAGYGDHAGVRSVAGMYGAEPGVHDAGFRISPQPSDAYEDDFH